MHIIDQYKQFHQTYKKKVFNHEKGVITYREIGHKKTVMLAFMQGLMFNNDAHFQLFMMLEKHVKVISIESVKPLHNAKDAIDMIKDLLDFLTIDTYHVMGMNFGGYLGLSYASQTSLHLNTLTLIQPLIYTKEPTPEEKGAIKTICEVIESVKELRKSLSLDDSKMALLEQIKEFIETHDLSDKAQQMDYFEFLLSGYLEKDEHSQLEWLSFFLNQDALIPHDLSKVMHQTYVLYGNDDDPFFGHDMALIACQKLSKSTIEFLDMTRYDMIIKPHVLAYKIIKFIENLRR